MLIPFYPHFLLTDYYFLRIFASKDESITHESYNWIITVHPIRNISHVL